MEFINGHRVDDLTAHQACNFDPIDVLDAVTDAFSQMIWGVGFVHGDPHPGNLLVRRARGQNAKQDECHCPLQLVLLDHGLYRDLGEAFRRNYCAMWMAIASNDASALQQAASNLHIQPQYHEFLPVIFASRLMRSVCSDPLSSPTTRDNVDADEMTMGRFSPSDRAYLRRTLAKKAFGDF